MAKDTINILNIVADVGTTLEKEGSRFKAECIQKLLTCKECRILPDHVIVWLLITDL